MRKEVLARAGIDVEDTIRRMGGLEELVEKYIRQFPQDLSHRQMMEAMEKEDMKGLLTAVHTLKGISASLGMKELSGMCSHVVEQLRAGETNEIQDEVEQIHHCYEKISQTIEQEWREV